jgi:mRNA interferase MazF
MVKKSLVLERGDIVWIDFRPTKGHEQSGLRPAVVLSSGRYNSVSGMVLVCPVTSKHKNYFFEVPVRGLEKDSFVLADQIRSFDIKERVLKKAGRISEPELSEVLAKATVLFQ